VALQGPSHKPPEVPSVSLQGPIPSSFHFPPVCECLTYSVGQHLPFLVQPFSVPGTLVRYHESVSSTLFILRATQECLSSPSSTLSVSLGKPFCQLLFPILLSTLSGLLAFFSCSFSRHPPTATLLF
jgi:hypothetical protein